MERDPSHTPPTLQEPQARPLGAFLPLLPLSPQYLLVQGLHGTRWGELLRQG